MLFSKAEILDLINQNKKPDKVACFLKQRMKSEALPFAESITKAFRSSKDKESKTYWLKVCRCLLDEETKH